VSNPSAARRVIAKLSPNHRGIAMEYAATAATAGLRTDLDPQVVPTMLIGAMIYRLISTGEPADEAFTGQVVEVLLAGLRSRT
jgi:Tetracyclin repressor-like, C-terminal domain